MQDILEQIVAHKRVELEQQKQRVPFSELVAQTEAMLAHRSCAESTGRSMRRALAESPYGIIAEFKRKSPSKGWIMENSVPEEVIPQYEAEGASACSVLTNTPYFGGELSYLERVRPLVDLPLLRKEFIIDEYQLFEARLVGADAVLLIAADLSVKECRMLARISHELGLETLLEIHQESELDYLTDDIDMVGVNNRNLGTFVTQVENSFRLAEKLPTDILKVSESGISNARTVAQLRQAGFRGFLIGECFMKTGHPGKALHQFIKELAQATFTEHHENS